MPVSEPLEPNQDAEHPPRTPSEEEDLRRSARCGLRGEPSRAHLVTLILGAYAEMPGLSLHLRQAARFFGLRETTCRVVLSDLVRDGRLRQSADGQYRVPNSGGA